MHSIFQQIQDQATKSRILYYTFNAMSYFFFPPYRSLNNLWGENNPNGLSSTADGPSICVSFVVHLYSPGSFPSVDIFLTS